MATGRILVVDDDMAFVDALAIFLEDEGFIVKRSSTGRQGVIESGRQHFDLALVDIHLPDMDGLEVISRIRQLQPKTQFIVITSDDSPETLGKCTAAWPVLLMAKPLSPNELLERICHMLGIPPPPSLVAQ